MIQLNIKELDTQREVLNYDSKRPFKIKILLIIKLKTQNVYLKNSP